MASLDDLLARPGAASRPVDAIVVLGARVHPEGRPGPLVRARVALACELFRKGAAGRIVLSGRGADRGVSEAAVMARLAREDGIPEAAIHIENRSRDTFENAAACTALFRRRGWRSGIVVTSGFHRPRAALSFKAAGMDDFRVSPAPTPLPARVRWMLIVREVPACLWYLWRAVAARRHRLNGRHV